ncbi:tripartite tricarboxylate transporter substrate-binding protein, partial [Cupriavidus pauculus]
MISNSLVTTVPLIIVTAANSPIKDLRQLVSMAKARPGQITFGCAGNGSGSHLAGELLSTMAGVKMNHVPYKGDAPSLTDVLGQQINVA